MFSSEFINDLKNKINLVELVSEYTTLHKAGTKLYLGKCPHPEHQDTNPSLRVWQRGYSNNKYDSWACMVCHSGSKDTKNKDSINYGSDCIAFYQWIEKVSWKQAVIQLANKYDIQIPTNEFDYLYKQKRIQANGFVKNLYSYPLKYLYDRGLSDKVIKDWMIGFQGNKIVFPLLNRYREPIAFTKRWLVVPEGSNDKYKNSANSKIFNKSSYLYGIHNLDNDFDEIRITEGPMDVIMANSYNVKNIVGTLGTAFTDNHVEIIKNLDKIPVFIMDGDEAGIRSAEKAIIKLAEVGVYSKILILPYKKDLFDVARELKYDTEEYINYNAVTYGAYKVNKIITSYENKTNELKIKYYKDLKNVLEEVPYEIERSILKDSINKRMSLGL